MAILKASYNVIAAIKNNAIKMDLDVAKEVKATKKIQFEKLKEVCLLGEV